MKTAHLFISGFVQGVGYRQFIRKNAEKRGITGWVTNLPDGRVEAVIQSKDQRILQEFIGFCNKGPFTAAVKGIVVQYEKMEALSEFTIVR